MSILLMAGLFIGQNMHLLFTSCAPIYVKNNANMTIFSKKYEVIDDAVAQLDMLGMSHEDVRTDEYTSKRFVFLRDPNDLPIELYER